MSCSLGSSNNVLKCCLLTPTPLAALPVLQVPSQAQNKTDRADLTLLPWIPLTLQMAQLVWAGQVSAAEHPKKPPRQQRDYVNFGKLALA